jgi:NADH:ubiquinone oxidoreductase subunit 6 (subunit J)
MESTWPLLLPLILGFLAVLLLLPRPRPFPTLWGGAAGGLALFAAGAFLVRIDAVNAESLLFYSFSGIALIGGGLLISQRNPVHAALSFALVVLSTCGLFLLQAAPFLTAATTIVYAGAIVVTFLFVIMLAQQAGSSDADQRSREPLLATVAGFVLLGTLLSLLRSTYDTQALERLLQRSEAAEAGLEGLRESQKLEQLSQAEIQASLPDHNIGVLLDDFQRESARLTPLPDYGLFTNALFQAKNEWNMPKVSIGALKKALTEIRTAGLQIRDSYAALQPRGPNRLSAFSGIPSDRALADVPKDTRGRLLMPGENVASLGRSLFTDYLLAVELGGMLLLVATIGAIAMVNRRPEGLR